MPALKTNHGVKRTAGSTANRLKSFIASPIHLLFVTKRLHSATNKAKAKAVAEKARARVLVKAQEKAVAVLEKAAAANRPNRNGRK